MSDAPPDPLPPDLASLLRAERDALAASAPDVERALSRVLATVGAAPVAPPTHGAAPTASASVTGVGALSKALVALTFAAGVGVGAAGHAVLRRPVAGPERVVVRTVEVERVVERRVEVPALAPVAAPTPPAAPPAESPPPPARAPSPAAPVDTSAAERALIDQARNALVRGSPDGALRAVREHERRFPHGALDEERDSLRVQALAAAGQAGEAASRAAEFHRRHPHSLLGATVDRAIAP